MYKEELERRLNLSDYTRLPNLLELGRTYYDVTDENDFKKMLCVADRYGQKYLKFFRLKNGVSIDTLISNLVFKLYSPNIPRVNSQLEIAMLTKSNNNFEIIANNYTETPKWIDVSEDRREKQIITVRRVIFIKYDNINKILIFSQDPVGEGSGIDNNIIQYIKNIFSKYNIEFEDYFEVVDLLKPVCDLLDMGIFKSSKIRGFDETTGREHETLARSKRDNLIDDGIFEAFKNGTYSLERMRLSHNQFRGTFEVFSGNILRVWFNINGENTDELTGNITSVL